jgi:exopolysaccharide production repressor protein
MFAPRFFVSMFGALAAFAVVTYSLTQSLSQTLVETIICAVLLQIGYFVGVLYLTWKAKKERKARLNDVISSASGAPTQGDDKAVGLPTPNMNRSKSINH